MTYDLRTQHPFIVTFFVLLLLVVSVRTKLIRLQPIRCRGAVMEKTDSGTTTSIDAVFLSREKIEIISNEDGDNTTDEDAESDSINDVTLCDVIPVPLISQRYATVINQLYSTDTGLSNSAVNSFLRLADVLVNRDKGFFDNLPYQWRRSVDSRKELYRFFSGSEGESCESGKKISTKDANVRSMSSEGEIFSFALKSILDCSVVGLLLETRDVLSEGSISIGGAVILAKTGHEKRWALSPSTTKMPKSSSAFFGEVEDNSAADGDDDDESTGCTVDVHIDELLLLSIALGRRPVWMDKQLFDSTACDATLTSSPSSETEMIIRHYRREQQRQKNVGSEPDVLKAWEIYNPATFLRMTTTEKRACLRASGVIDLPRPRQGKAALDNLLLDLMDDAVRGEVTRLSAKPTSSFPSASSVSFTKRQELLRGMSDALERGDTSEAERLREEFAELTLLRADPTQPEGSYSRFLDQDEWYLQARRKSMGIGKTAKKPEK